jgi:leader peptidase (prepilin peptidase)/N-methyltransferase
MNNWQFLQISLALTWSAFIFTFGAICGSFINVLVYRLPRNLNIVSPPSACPACSTTLTWRENIPVFGWLFLRGKCRFCKTPISPEYPAVEAFTGLLFVFVYMLWFSSPPLLDYIGIDSQYWKPEWARAGLSYMWPGLVLAFVLLGSLITATLIDLRTYTIPLALCWCMAIMGVVVHPLHALLMPMRRGWRMPAPHEWTIPTFGNEIIGLSLGAISGIALSTALVQMGVMRRSFHDYEAWERTVDGSNAAKNEQDDSAADDKPSVKLLLYRTFLFTAPAVTLMFVGFFAGHRLGQPQLGMGVGMLAGLVIGALLRRLAVEPSDHVEPVWVQYPHARREMLREIGFLLPCIALSVLGFYLGGNVLPAAPLWLGALGGSVAGYLAGGGVVWAVRIGGSLAFGKEAMGLGDVHLMAGVGAIVGVYDPVIAFFVAPFFGIAAAVLGGMKIPPFSRIGAALPYGPYLAVATVLVVLGKPWVEWGISMIAGRGIDLP